MGRGMRRKSRKCGGRTIGLSGGGGVEGGEEESRKSRSGVRRSGWWC